MSMKDEADRQKRRAANLIWNAADDYSIKPFMRAYDENGKADVYFNSIIGAVYKFYDFNTLRALFLSLGDGEQADDYSALIWQGLENSCFERASDQRPALLSLRQDYAESTLKMLSRRDVRDLSESERLLRAHYMLALCQSPELTARERGILEGMSFPMEFTTEDVVVRVRQTLLKYYGFVPRAGTAKSFRLPSWLRPARAKYSGMAVDLEEEEKADSGLRRLRSALRGERSEPAMRDYLERCFGLPVYSASKVSELEDALCTGAHAGCRLHFTRGEYNAEEVRDTETALHRQRNASQRDKNRKSYLSDLPRNRTEIMRLGERIRNCLLVYLDPTPVKSRAGTLRPDRIWRAQRLGDGSIFERPGHGESGDFKVDVLLDASASQLYRQERVATQGFILAEGLTRCSIPVRVYSFCSVEGSTIVRIFRDYNESGKNEEIFAYTAEGWNRDGLALRAAGQLMDESGGENRLLIVLSDASPNDMNYIGGRWGGSAYRGEAGIKDSAAEVAAMRRRGIAVMCVFTGEEADMPAARLIYGKDVARIRDISQFADAAGSIIQEKIRQM